MSSSETSGDNWIIDCSDEELSKDGCMEGNSWTPNFIDLQNMYENIGNIHLEWKCPGRRLPSPIHNPEDGPQIQQTCVKSPSELSNFEFKDEMSSLQLRVRREGEDTLRGSAKKKTTSFDGIVSNIMRHKMIQQMEKKLEADGS